MGRKKRWVRFRGKGAKAKKKNSTFTTKSMTLMMMIVMMILGEETQAALPKPADSTRSGSGGNGKTRTAMHRADWVGKRGKFKKVKNRHDENYRFTWPVLLRRKLSYCSHDCMYISCMILLLFPMQPCTRYLSLLPVQIRP